MDTIVYQISLFKRILYLLSALLLCNMYVAAVDTLAIVSGYVYDATDYTPLANVNIVETNTHAGTSTDTNGFFSLRVPVKNLWFRITHVGYTERVIRVASYRPDSLLRIMLTKSVAQLDEVNVTGSKSHTLNVPQMGVLSFSQKGIKDIPTLFGEADVIKALQTQPGVSAGTEGLSGMYVRGGNEDENLYMLDGVPIYKITHLGGIFSAINVEAVQDVTFYKSSFPSRYGGRLSSVLDVRTRQGGDRKSVV